MTLPATTVGTDFENEVAKLYRLLGYTVKQAIDIDGQQVDLVVSQDRPGLGKVSYVVECKYKSHGKVDNQSVMDFLAVFNAVKRCHPIFGGVLVTNHGFTRAAKRVVESHHEIFLTEISSLRSESLIRSEPHRLAERYEASVIFSTYVPQRAHGRVPNRATDGSIKDVVANLYEWTSRARAGTCFVLADYGTGKTTLLSRIRYLHLKMLAAAKSSPLPVLFLLKNFYKFDKLDDFIAHSFQENYHSAIDPAWFWDESSEGKLVLLLDGFDEISIESNPRVRQMLLARIAPLLHTKSPTIISCRPSYFVDSAELAKLRNGTQSDPIGSQGSYYEVVEKR